MGGAYLTLDAGARDFEEAPTIDRIQEMRISTTIFDVFRLCD